MHAACVVAVRRLDQIVNFALTRCRLPHLDDCDSPKESEKPDIKEVAKMIKQMKVVLN